MKTILLTLWSVTFLGVLALVIFFSYTTVAKVSFVGFILLTVLALIVAHYFDNRAVQSEKLIKRIIGDVQTVIGLQTNGGCGFSPGETVMWVGTVRPVKCIVEAGNWTYGMLILRPVGATVTERLKVPLHVVPMWEATRAED